MCRCPHLLESRHIVFLKLDADPAPESRREGAAGDQMCSAFSTRATDFASVAVQAMLLQEVLFCLDAVLDKKPAEELHFGGAQVSQMNL